MAGVKELKGRIVSVKNTRKITRTMEMVATAKSKRMTDRVHGAQPYGRKIAEIMSALESLKDQVDSPFLRQVPDPKRVAMLVVTANRGLCGGYNSNTLRLARRRIAEHEAQGREVELHVVGKKGIGYFKFLKRPVARSYNHIDDKFSYADAEAIATGFMDTFAEGKVDAVEIVSMIYYASSKQNPGIAPLLPVGITGGESAPAKGTSKPGADAAPKYKANTVYEPSPEVILKRLLPLVVKTVVYRALLEAVASEQIFRRIAMKSATDNAGEMIKLLTRQYNRVRQAGITQELSEIVAGADALG